MKKLITFLILILVFSCDKSNLEKWKTEIIETEKAFCEMVKTDGISNAFIYFAAEDAVLIRDNKLIIGKSSIKDFYKKSSWDNVKLIWKPDFVEVAESGELGYTYGKYTYTYTDSTGIEKDTEGVFHTVWKRQSDGSWKFVWD